MLAVLEYLERDGASPFAKWFATKKGQDRDIAMAHMRWKDYKKRKSQET